MMKTTILTAALLLSAFVAGEAHALGCERLIDVSNFDIGETKGRTCSDNSATGIVRRLDNEEGRFGWRLSVNLKNPSAFSASGTLLNAGGGILCQVSDSDGGSHTSVSTTCYELPLVEKYFRLLAGDGQGS